jgi:hypothetical protein
MRPWRPSPVRPAPSPACRDRACCACRNSNSHIQMMKTAEKWRRRNATNGMYCSRRRRVLVDRKVRASLVIVGSVRSQQMAEMPLAEHDNVVKTFPPDRTDRPFTISVLPRRSRRGWPIPNAHRPKATDEDVTVDGVAVTNDVSRCCVPTIGLRLCQGVDIQITVVRNSGPGVAAMAGEIVGL